MRNSGFSFGLSFGAARGNRRETTFRIERQEPARSLNSLKVDRLYPPE